MKSKPEKTDHCLNCDNTLSGENFCPQCGQKNDARKLTLANVFSESLSNLFAFDGRFFYTLSNLFRFPGKVPRQFVEGKRTLYMNPVRLYFLASVLLLTVIQIKQGGLDIVKIKGDNSTTGAADTIASENTEGFTITSTEDPLDTVIASDADPDLEDKYLMMKGYYNSHRNVSIENALDSLNLPNTFMNRFLYAQSAKIAHFDKEAFNRYIFSKLFWVLFLFLPILALLLKLLYIRRSFYYPEHLFFTFYIQSAFFILMALLIPWPLGEGILIGAVLLFALYLFIAMKRFYRQSTAKTLLKFFLLNMLLVPSFALFFSFATLVAFILFF